MSIRRVAEKTGFCTDSNFKPGSSLVEQQSHAQLVAFQGSTTRSMASSATSTILNGALSCVNPVFMGATVVGLHKLGVACRNKRNVKQEMKQRQMASESAQQPQDSEKQETMQRTHRARDIFIGVSIGAIATATQIGIVGGEALLETLATSFVDVIPPTTWEGGSCMPADAIVNSGTQPEAFDLTTYPHAPEENAAPMTGIFQNEHPSMARADMAFHDRIGFAGNWVAEGMQSLTGWQVDERTTWEQMGEMRQNGAHGGVLVGQATVAGVVGEVGNPVQVVEVVVDDAITERDCREEELRRRRIVVDGQSS